MEVPATGARSGHEGWRRYIGSTSAETEAKAGDRESRELRARWRTASLAAGWRFPNDWALPEVDAVCAAVISSGIGNGKTENALAGLGGARAKAGAGLAETFGDLAALHAVLAEPAAVDGFVVPDVDATPARLLRITALGWADMTGTRVPGADVTDALTGLATDAYLLRRLAEVYRQAGRDGTAVAERHTLLAVSLDFAGMAGWRRLTGMILLADAVQVIFDGEETATAVGPSTVAVLIRRQGHVASSAVSLRRELNKRLSCEPQLDASCQPKIRMLRLPSAYDEACALIDRLRQR